MTTSRRWWLVAGGSLLWGIACGQDNYPGGIPELSGVPGDGATQCRPDLDGVVDDGELPVVVGAAVRYYVATQEARFDLEGRAEGGDRIWDLSRVEATDRMLEVHTASLEGTWYRDLFSAPEDLYQVTLDASGDLLGVMQRSVDDLTVLGSVSREEQPAAGQTRLIYDSPASVFRLPLGLGDTWTEAREVRDGVVQGLPVAARYRFEQRVLREGRLRLPDLTFERVLQVVNTTHQQAIVGPMLSWSQVSWVAECFGEVARATTPLVQTEDGDLDHPPVIVADDAAEIAVSEVRRLGF